MEISIKNLSRVLIVKILNFRESFGPVYSKDSDKFDSLGYEKSTRFRKNFTRFLNPYPGIVDIKSTLNFWKMRKELTIIWNYRAGPHKVAIISMTGTKYACNVSNDWDLLCLQLCSKGTKYACNNHHNRGLICPQSQLQREPNILAI